MQKNASVDKSNGITGRVVKNEGPVGPRISEVAQRTALRPPALANPWTPKPKREPSSGGAFGKNTYIPVENYKITKTHYL